MKDREQLLKQIRVVGNFQPPPKNLILKKIKIGVTCAACTFPVLNEYTFPIIFLDEASQMLEPMSVIPLSRFSASRLV